MVIYGPTYAQFDEDLGPIMLADCKYRRLTCLVALTNLSGFHTPYVPLMQDSKFAKLHNPQNKLLISSSYEQ